jgi:hypothetical protein
MGRDCNVSCRPVALRMARYSLLTQVLPPLAVMSGRERETTAPAPRGFGARTAPGVLPRCREQALDPVAVAWASDRAARGASAARMRGPAVGCEALPSVDIGRTWAGGLFRNASVFKPQAFRAVVGCPTPPLTLAGPGGQGPRRGDGFGGPNAAASGRRRRAARAADARANPQSLRWHGEIARPRHRPARNNAPLPAVGSQAGISPAVPSATSSPFLRGPERRRRHGRERYLRAARKCATLV